MKWIKHHADAHEDAKLRKVMIRYGAEGYAVYWYCLELIAGKVSAEDLTFELEHDAELIAHSLRIDSARVQEIMVFMVGLGLFEESEGRITCLKIARHLDERFARSDALKAIIREAKARTLTHENLKRILQSPEDAVQTSAIPSEYAVKTISGSGAKRSGAKRSKAELYSHRFAEFWSVYPPGGHLKLPHPWPGQIPPAEAAGRVDGYTLSARFATRAAASRSRQLFPSNFSRCAWCISRSSSGVTMTTSPSSLAQSSTGRLDVMIVERFS